MRIEIASFSERGFSLGEKLAGELSAGGDTAALIRFGGNGNAGDGAKAPGQGTGEGKAETPSEWTERVFASAEALVFIGSCGIAVRLIAPWVKTKMRDPAVVVLDEFGRHAVSLLSGHVGGANALTTRIAAHIGAEAVITTATDLAGLFAFDAWAARRGYAILNPKGTKKVAAAMLRGNQVGLTSFFPLRSASPDGVKLVDEAPDVRIDFRRHDDECLQIVPKAGVLGVGCRRGVSVASLREAFRHFCDEAEVVPEAVGLLASVVLKKDEAGVIEFARELAVPFRTYSAEELRRVPGEFADSPFVESVAGVGNVCERAALAGAMETWGGGKLAVLKATYHGVALALAMGGVEMDFHTS